MAKARGGLWVESTLVLFLASVALAGCLGGGAKNEQEYERVQAKLLSSFQVVTPTGDPQATILSASGTLTIDDRVTIGSAGTLEIVGAFGTAQTRFQAGVQAHANVTSKPSVFLSASDVIDGFLRSGSTVTNTQSPAAKALGGITQNASITGQITKWDVNFPDTNGGDILLDGITTFTGSPAPGSWGNLTARPGTVVNLRAGTYYFLSVLAETGSQIKLDKSGGAIIIYVRNSYTLRGAMLTTAGAEGDEFVGYLGTSVAYIESPLLGTIVAPNADVELRRPSNNAPHRGAAFGLGVHVFSDAKVQRVPFNWNLLCPSGDSDGDGVSDCADGCPKDPAKTAPGVCLCGNPETDADNDKLPYCIDFCDNDPNNSVRGQCGCVGDTIGAKPAGTPCTETPCPITTGLTCNGAGVCGSPTSCIPSTGCTLRKFNQSYYWFCPGPVSFNQASTNCRAVPGRTLVRISTQQENEFVAKVMAATSWTGANDQSVGGVWRWSNSAGNNGDQFWSGGPSGSRVNDRFTKWNAGEPNTGATCATVAKNGVWAAQGCAQTMGYVCEQTVGLPPPPPPPPPPVDPLCPTCSGTQGGPGGGYGSSGTGTGGTGGGGAANCVPSIRGITDTEFAVTQQEIEDCNAAQQAAPPNNCDPVNNPTSAACVNGCKGAATVPPAGGTCKGFQPEEQGYCQLTDVIETGCPATGNCCNLQPDVVFVSAGNDAYGVPIPQGFDTTSGGLSYVDDAFQGGGTAAPAYASGVRVTSGGNPGAALQVSLGGIDAATVNNMSGGWQITVTVPAKSFGAVKFDYNLTQSPNYETDELSRVLVSIDGNLRGVPYDDYVAQVVGDVEGGPNITTGWRSAAVNLGKLAPGTHVLRIGGLNNKKTLANESTTILLDNIVFRARPDDCPDGYLCGPTYAGGCNPCETTDADGVCNNPCGDPILRCGKPDKIETFTDENGVVQQRACANSNLFPDPLCEEIQICETASTAGNSDPRTGGGLEPTTFDPTPLTSTVTTPIQYTADPPCPGFTVCPAGPQHRWCHYKVDLWADGDGSLPAGQRPANPVQPKATPPSGKQGSSGQGSPVSFTFTPDTTLEYGGSPLPFGESDFFVKAAASFGADVQFDLGPAHGHKKIVDALVKIEGNRCAVKNMDSHLMFFDKDFFPSSAKFEHEIPGCADAVETYRTTADRAKKAYRDAIDLLTQYKDHKAAGQKFQADLCDKLVGAPPSNFPPCTPGETAATTMNRFVQFYKDELGRMSSAFDALKGKGLNLPVPLASTAQRNTQTVLRVTFPVGPIPCLLEVEAYVEYGLDGSLVFTVTPVDPFSSAETQPIATISAVATPYVLAGISLFVGVGFGVNGFSVSAGVEGAITLARLSLNAHAGAGVGLKTADDIRPIPDDILKVAIPGVADSKQTLFPASGAKQYNMALTYDYGLGLTLSQILQGTISARVRIKFFFFSKTWRAVLLRFPGFGPIDIPLLNGGGAITALSVDPLGWGNVQMPIPFVDLQPLNAAEVLTGTTVDYNPSQVGALFYDGMCECKENGQSCVRDGDCCGKPSSTCFSDPLTGGAKVCSACRPANMGTASTCNRPEECCSPDSKCLDIPDSLPAGIKVCTCVSTGGRCDVKANCCGEDPTVSQFVECEDDTQDTKGTAYVCRTCRHLAEPCDGTLLGVCCQGEGGEGSNSCSSLTGMGTCVHNPIR
jgi:hypothetical protein